MTSIREPEIGSESRYFKSKRSFFIAGAVFLCLLGGFAVIIGYPRVLVISNAISTEDSNLISKIRDAYPPLNTRAYDQKLLQLANLKTANASATSTSNLWPVKTIYPDPGAILPFKRIVAYYGNLYSPQMGVLGEYPPDEVLKRLTDTASLWQAADPGTTVLPALDYVAVAAQATPGADGKYRLRMPPDQINEVIEMANQINGIVFLDIQVGLSDVQTEVPLFKSYLKLPQVNLALDPEFSMKTGKRPGTVIGTMDAADINWAAEYLAKIVDENNLPPKILVVHRFTQAMVTNYRQIRPLPEVQIVMDMDGFGPPAQKLKTYHDFIYQAPVQFTGFKLFYKNDIREPGSHLLTPAEILKLSPQPSYIQYQ